MNLTQIIPTVLRHDGTELRARQVMPLVVAGGAIYGCVMGSFGGLGTSHWLQIAYSAAKVPLLLGVSFALTLPSFFMLNTLLGLREDFRSALRAVCTAQAGLAITLCSLCPFVALWYASCDDYQAAILFNGVMFAAATLAGQVLLKRVSRQLIDRNSKHRMVMRSWTLIYVFIAMQMAWVLRPFVGQPGESTTFFRLGAWGNAYVVIENLVVHSIRR